MTEGSGVFRIAMVPATPNTIEWTPGVWFASSMACRNVPAPELDRFDTVKLTGDHETPAPRSPGVGPERSVGRIFVSASECMRT